MERSNLSRRARVVKEHHKLPQELRHNIQATQTTYLIYVSQVVK